MAQITSAKKDAKGGRRMRHLDHGRLTEKFPIVFSCGAVILNMTDGARNFAVCLDADETERLRQRLAETT